MNCTTVLRTYKGRDDRYIISSSGEICSYTSAKKRILKTPPYGKLARALVSSFFWYPPKDWIVSGNSLDTLIVSKGINRSIKIAFRGKRCTVRHDGNEYRYVNLSQAVIKRREIERTKRKVLKERSQRVLKALSACKLISSYADVDAKVEQNLLRPVVQILLQDL